MSSNGEAGMETTREQEALQIFNRKVDIFEVVGDLGENDIKDWDKIESRFECVKLRSINADTDSIIIKDKSFSGLASIKIIISEQSDGELIETGETVPAQFSGQFGADGKPVVRSLKPDLKSL
jgi:hypothetical protein